MKVKVAEFRDAISHLSDVFASARSVANSFELETEKNRLVKVFNDVSDMECSRANSRDRERLASLSDAVTLWLSSFAVSAANMRLAEISRTKKVING